MRARRLSGLAFLCAVALAAGAACRRNNPTGPDGPSGAIQGVVTAADGVTRIGLATITLIGASGVTVTDLQGAYTLSDVPEGQYQLRARRGNFEATIQVSVAANQATAASFRLQPSGKLAYVAGAFDSIQALARDQWGNPMDELNASQLGSASVLNQYRMIFLNCGLDTTPASNPSVISTLLAWIRSGGTLYASDLAIDYVQALYPQEILGTERGDVQTIAAMIIDTDLQVFSGTNAAEIAYTHAAWNGLSNVPPQTRVLLRAPYLSGGNLVLNRPLAIVVPDGSGKLVYTTFHNGTGAKPDQITALRFMVYLP